MPSAHEKALIFCSHFRGQVDLVSSIYATQGRRRQLTRHDMVNTAFHRKILLLTMIDAMARFGPRGSAPGTTARQRFVDFVRTFGDWQVGAFVSVPVLAARLRGTGKDPILLRRLNRRLRNGDADAGNTESVMIFDEEEKGLVPLATTAEGLREIGRATHLNLLYDFRNFSVHEFREPGYGMEAMAEAETEPRYHTAINDPSWRLLYPFNFIRELVLRCVENLERDLIRSRCNPYKGVYDSSTWLDPRRAAG